MADKKLSERGVTDGFIDISSANKPPAQKKAMPKSFIITLVLLVGLPVIGLIGWYILTVGLQLSGSSMSAEQAMAAELAKAKESLRNQIIKRASTENFEISNVDACDTIEDQYRIPIGYLVTDFTRRQLVGLKQDASDTEIQERCILFAKVVARMEKLAHHERHVFVCNGAKFKTDDAGKYFLLPDRKGVVEVKGGFRKLVPIRRHTHVLLGDWQIYNLGDGCLVIGMSKSGTFSFSGSVQITP